MNAESLYNVCEFEHALLIFTKGKKLAPDSERIEAGISKCKKTILNKVGDGDVFFFPGSKRFIDHLRKGGNSIVENFINKENAAKTWKTTCNLASMSKNTAIATSLKKEEKHKAKKLVVPDRMKKDKDYLRNLEKSLVPLSGMEEDRIREQVVKTVHETITYLDSREEFWKQLG